MAPKIVAIPPITAAHIIAPGIPELSLEPSGVVAIGEVAVDEVAAGGVAVGEMVTGNTVGTGVVSTGVFCAAGGSVIIGSGVTV